LQSACFDVFTGAVARIEHRGALVFERAYGATRADALARPVYRDTRFDLASLTKLFVASCALAAVASGRLGLDDSLASHFAGWHGTAHEAITFRMLLAHNSGLNSGADCRQLLGSNVLEFSLLRDLVAPPGERVIYSDLGFIVLGALLERISGQSLQKVVAQTFDSPTLTYRPPATTFAAIPATEDDGWRGRVQGFVHDEKAYLMGGTAGHAGLFGTAGDVAALGERYVGTLNGRARFLNETCVRAAVSLQADDPVLRRGLGWALKATDENSCGRWFSMQSFGHTGFVGTCIWIDPERDLNAVLLTNSVYYGRNDSRDLRAGFYEAVVQDLGLR